MGSIAQKSAAVNGIARFVEAHEGSRGFSLRASVGGAAQIDDPQNIFYVEPDPDWMRRAHDVAIQRLTGKEIPA